MRTTREKEVSFGLRIRVVEGLHDKTSNFKIKFKFLGILNCFGNCNK
jgi:hypothetical protein